MDLEFLASRIRLTVRGSITSPALHEEARQLLADIERAINRRRLASYARLRTVRLARSPYRRRMIRGRQ